MVCLCARWTDADGVASQHTKPTSTTFKMSSNTFREVPVLTGVNFPEWKTKMVFYLKQQGQYKAVRTIRPPGLIHHPAVGAVSATENTPAVEAQEEWVEGEDPEWWEDMNEKAIGSIVLRCAPECVGHIKELDTAKEMLEKLEELYGKPGIMAWFLEFRQALSVNIPDNSHPGPAIDKIMTHLSRFEEMGERHTQLTSFVKAMIVLNRLPPTMTSLVQIMANAKPSGVSMEEIMWRLTKQRAQHTRQRETEDGLRGPGTARG